MKDATIYNLAALGVIVAISYAFAVVPVNTHPNLEYENFPYISNAQTASKDSIMSAANVPLQLSDNCSSIGMMTGH